MKKCIFFILFMLVVLLAVNPINVSAADVDFFSGGTPSGYCDYCKETVTWQPLTNEVVANWAGNYSTANGIHYYVAEETVTTSKILTVDSGEALCLHLNGNTFKRNGVRVLTVNGRVAVMDHTVSKGILQASANNTSTAGVVRLNKSGSAFDLYGGTLRLVNGTHTEADNGGCMYLVSGSTFNMHGGVMDGGKSDANGGILYITSGATATLDGGTITGGIAAGYGGNIYAAGKLILGNCAITGGSAATGSDLYFASTATLTVKSCFAGTPQAVFNESLLPTPLNGSALAETFATCEGAFPGKICLENEERESWLYGKAGDTKLHAFVDMPEDTPLPATCEHCNKTVTWLPLTKAVADAWAGNYNPSGGTHYYVAEDAITIATRLTLAAGEALCLHLNGREFSFASTRIFAVTGTLNLMDHDSDRGLVSAIGDYSSTGCVIRIYNGGAVNMYGGTVQMKTGSTTAKTFAGNGGCVYLAEGGTFTMNGGIVTDGKASAGGNIFVSKNAAFYLNGGTVRNGQTVSNTAHSSISNATKHGGNIYLASGSTMVMTGGTVENGVAVESGGNIMTQGAFTISGGIISDGKAKLAGNLYVSSNATANINGGSILDGEASDRGGNIYMSSTSSRLNMTAGTVSGGKSVNNGGNLHANNGVATLSGGTITGGNGNNGGNIVVNAGANSASNHLKLTGTTVTDGTATGWGGNLYVTGTLILDDSTVSGGSGGKGGQDICIGADGKLQVANFAGSAMIYFNAAHLPTPIQGGTLTEALDSCDGSFSGKLYVENTPKLPYLYGKSGDTSLYVTGASRVSTDGTRTWYADNAAMVAALDGTEDYICAASGQLTLPHGSYLIDLAGQNINVTGSGSVTFFDSANKDYATYGTATVSGITVNNSEKTNVKNDLYYTLCEEHTYSFHLLQVALTNVNVRPSCAGIYYSGLWNCDAKLGALVESFGVAVSLVHTPDASFETDSTVLATAYTAADLRTDSLKTGVLIENILSTLKSPEENDINGRKPVYARAYIKLTNGTVLMSDSCASESLYSALAQLDRLIDEDPYIYRHYQRDAQDFYEAWQDKGMGQWELQNLLPSARPQESPEEAEVMKILILGSSRSVNTFYMLYDVLKDQMPDKEFVVGVMYYSGCSMTMHADFIKREASVYRYYRNTTGLWDITEPVTMEQGLKDQKWDVIFLQAGSGDLANQVNLECRLYITDYVDKMLPDHPHEFWYHATWFNSTDPALYEHANTTIDPSTVDQYAGLTKSIEAAQAHIFKDAMFEGHISSGTPMMYALKVLEIPEIELYRDHTHLSDYGCLLVGYAFYTQLTGNPVTEIGIDLIETAKRQPQYKNQGDLTITQEMKDMILQTAEYTRNNPWTIPVKE